MPRNPQRPTDALALTAWWTAAARARESERADRLFNDPWAASLAGPDGMLEFDQTTLDHGSEVVDIQAITTRYFDEFLLRIVATQAIQQVVVVAAGLDSRAFRLVWSPGTVLFELDQALVFAYKEKHLRQMGATPTCVRRLVTADLREAWGDAICEAGFDSRKRSVWLLEGFLYFLQESAVLQVLSTITDLAAAGSWMGLDVVNADMLTSPWTRGWVEAMAAAGVPWLSALDQPETVLATYGWTAVVRQPGEEGANFGRSTYPVSPRSTPGIPRALLVTAIKQSDG